MDSGDPRALSFGRIAAIRRPSARRLIATLLVDGTTANGRAPRERPRP